MSTDDVVLARLMGIENMLGALDARLDALEAVFERCNTTCRAEIAVHQQEVAGLKTYKAQQAAMVALGLKTLAAAAAVVGLGVTLFVAWWAKQP